MAYTNQTTSSLADLISKLNTFLGANGWTTHHVPASGEFAARKTPGGGVDIGFASQWDTGTPSNLGIYHFHGAVYNAGASPWAQNDDSGNGAASTSNATLGGQRHVAIGNSPLQFWCFEDDHYFHVVVQTTATIYRHFGAGLLNKINDWDGGEYVYGHRRDVSFSGSNTWLVGNNTVLLDGRLADTSPGISNAEEYAATVHVENLDNQPASGLYGVCMGNQNSANLGQDRQGSPEDRIHILGGFGGGPMARMLSQYRGTKQRALNPLWEIMQFYWNRTTDNIYPLSTMPDVRGCNIREFAAGEEVVQGSDTWTLFPAVQKSSADTESSTGFSGYQGIAYKKVTA